MDEMDDRAIAELIAALAQAWNRCDAAAFGSAFAADADFIHILGGGGQGRAAIEAGHRQLFKTIYRDSRVEYRIEKIRRLPGGAAVALIRQTLGFRDGEDWIVMECRPTAVLQPGPHGPEIVLFQNTRVASAEAADADRRLLRNHPHAPRSAAGCAISQPDERFRRLSGNRARRTRLGGRANPRESEMAKSAKPVKAETGGKVDAVHKLVQPSEQLAAVIGKDPLARGEVISRIWAYIKSNKLQNPDDGRQIRADDKLKPVFGKDEISMFEMNKRINEHLS